MMARDKQDLKLLVFHFDASFFWIGNFPFFRYQLDNGTILTGYFGKNGFVHSVKKSFHEVIEIRSKGMIFGKLI